MIETVLNERIAEIGGTEPWLTRIREKDRRRVRRIMLNRKNDRLLRIINYGGYALHRGYIDWGFDGLSRQESPALARLKQIAINRGKMRQHLGS